jgi:Holliday junction DNA helicase RuvA
MIATLHGILAHKAADHLVVDVNGVGYRASLSRQSFSRLPATGEKVFLFIHTAVREDDITLFGFMEEEERRLFQRLITVNGIGPKLALTILSGILPQELVEALHREDLVRLTAISGIGKKTAERMILDLKDKLTEFLIDGRPVPKKEKVRVYEEAVSALINLGYNRSIAERTLSQVPLKEGIKLETVIRESLKMLSEANR